MNRQVRRREFAPNTEFDIFDIRGLVQTARYQDMDYEIKVTERVVSFNGAKHRNMSTLFGGNLNDPVIVDEEGVKKLQHDLVHCCLSGVPEGHVKLRGLTPDILIPVANGQYDILEITTRESSVMAVLDAAFEDKLRKYVPLVHPQPAEGNSLNVLVVTRDGCFDLYGRIPDSEGTRSLIRAYNQGLKIQREYSESPGYKEFSRFNTEDMKSLRECLASIEYKDHPLMPVRLFEKVSPPHPGSFMISKEGMTFKDISFDSYEFEMRARTEQRLKGIKPTIVHCPMLIVEPTISDTVEAEACVGTDIYSTLFNKCLASGLHHGAQRDFETLRAVSEIDSENRKNFAPPKDAPDMIWIQPTESQILSMALKGLLVKKEKKENHPLVKSQRKYDAKDINFDEDLSALTEYINQDVNFGIEKDLFEEVEHCFDKKVTLDYKDLMNKCSSLDDVECLRFLDRALREIQQNLKRFPNDKGKLRQFYFRMIPGYKAFILFRTSSPGAGNGDMSHIFYAIFFQGESLSEAFEKVHDLDNGWKRTDFLSTDQERLSQTIGIHYQVLLHWFYILDESGDPNTSSSDGLSPETNLEKMKTMIRPLRHIILILTEDKQVTSTALQDFRYYYMKLNTRLNSSKDWAEHIVEKFPKMIRSRLLLYYIRTLIKEHRLIPVEKRREEPEEIDEEEAQADDTDLASFDILKSVMTPFEFRINTPSDLVRAMYMGYMHNKNEGFSGHGAVKMLEKTLTSAMAFKNLNLKMEEEMDYCCQNTVNPDLLKKFQHSSPAMTHSCWLIKQRLCDRAGIKLAEYEGYIEDEMIRFMLKDTLSDLATTKASTIPFTITRMETPDSDEFKSFAQRRKCIEAILSSWSEFTHRIAVLNLEAVIEAIERGEDGCLQVTMEKKKQIGGTRETYILTINGRLIVKFFSDPFRAICNLHPWEVLTKPENKQSFIPDHYSARRNMSGKFKATVKVSADCSQWAQGFNQFNFAELARELLPKTFHPLCQRVLLMHRKKTIALPKSLVKQFLDEPTTKLSSEGVNKVKREFLGLDKAKFLRRDHEATFQNHVDMMQGILHYPSSVNHVAELEYQAELVKVWAKSRGVDCLVSSVGSSDDEGDLFSFSHDDKDYLKKVVGQFMNALPRIMNTCAKLHCMTISWVKTSFTVHDIIEVNSEFHFGNTLQRALSKFINNALHVEPDESLHLQISSLYSKLRELRANGASGALCHVASILQCLIFTDNLGVRNMSWYRPGLYKELTNSLTTSSGYYFILNELKAGLVDSAFVNWRACKLVPSSKKIIYFLNNYALPLTPEEHVTSKFSLGPNDKYKKMLRRLGLEGQSQNDMDDDLFRIVLLGSETLDEEKRKITHTILTPSISKSMRHLNRTHASRMAPHVMWSAMYRDDLREGFKLSLPSLIRRCIDTQVEESLITINNLFPMADQFEMIRSLDDLEYVVGPMKGFRRLFHCYVSPQYYGSDHMQNLKEVLMWKWFSKIGRLSARVSEQYFIDLRENMPWIKPTLEETKKTMPFRNLNELSAFLNSSTVIRASFSALVRGRPRKSFSTVQALTKGNTFSRRILEASTEVKEVTSENSSLNLSLTSQKLGDRFSAWKEILRSSEEEEELCRDHLIDLFMEDLSSLKKTVPPLIGVSKTGSPDDDMPPLYLKLLTKEIDTRSLFSELKSCELYETIQKKESGSFHGDFASYKKVKGILYYYKVSGKTKYVEADCSREKFEKVTRIIPDSFKQDKKLKVPVCTFDRVDWVKGNLVIVVTSRNNEWYLDLPRAHAREVHFKETPSTFCPSLRKWLTREAMTTDELISDSHPLGLDEESIMTRCIMRIYNDSRRSMRVKKIQERMEANIEDQEDDPPPDDDFKLPTGLDAILDMFADNISDIDVTEKFDEPVSEFLFSEESDEVERFLGMESFSMESYVSRVEQNRSLYSAGKIIESFMMNSRYYGGNAKELSLWYKKLSQ